MLNCYYMDYTGGCSDEQSLVLYEQLNESRKARVDKIKNPDMKRKQILTGAFVQQCLSKELGINVAAIRLSENEYGKPFVLGANIHFNLSHSGKYAVLAVSDSNVGIDIERKTKDCMKLAKRFFCKEECDLLASLETQEELENAFLRYWTIKEAYVKCIGTGLILPLNSFCVKQIEQRWIVDVGDVVPGKDKDLNRRIGISSFDFFEKYKVAICKEGSTTDCITDDFPPDKTFVKELKWNEYFE